MHAFKADRQPQRTAIGHIKEKKKKNLVKAACMHLQEYPLTSERFAKARGQLL